MIQLTPANKRFSAKSDWLESNFSFSFGPYYDEANLQFGPLRVLNDDIIQPSNGFGIHPHREAEVVSIVLSGQLKHEYITFDTEKLKNNLLPVVSGKPGENIVMIHQDVTLYLSKLDAQRELSFKQSEGKKNISVRH